jgi:hypothetical protein
MARAMAKVQVGFTGRTKERVSPKALSSVTGQSHDQIITRQANRKIIVRQSNHKTITKQDNQKPRCSHESRPLEDKHKQEDKASKTTKNVHILFLAISQDSRQSNDARQ